MAYVSTAHMQIALFYLRENAHPLLTSLLAMFSAALPVSDEDGGAAPFGAREENVLLDQFFSPPGASSDRKFFVPFGLGSEPGWRDHRYAGRSLQRMRKDRARAGVAVRQSTADNTRWSFRGNFREQLQTHAAELVGQVPISLVMIGIWLFRQKSVASLDELVSEVVSQFGLKRYEIPDNVFSADIPANLSALPLVSEPISPASLLALLPSVVHTLEFDDDNDPAAASTPFVEEEEPGRWDISASDLGDLGGLQGLLPAALQALAALRAGMHVIFTGPPGTGKTSLAVALCRRAGFPWWLVSATDQWTTFDTIGGYFPLVDQESDGEKLDFLPGHIVDTIQNETCLIIDEINRADIDKAFGEMFTLLAGQEVTLPFRRRSAEGAFKRIRITHGASTNDPAVDAIAVPRWWRLIGAMNDADKQSLKHMSYAFMRRFAFVSVPVPSFQVYSKILADGRTKYPVPDWTYDAVVRLFCGSDATLAKVGAIFGPAIPLAMLRHGASRLEIGDQISEQSLLRQLLESHMAPQLQGRADLHEGVMSALTELLGPESATFADQLSVWTGFVQGQLVDA